MSRIHVDRAILTHRPFYLLGNGNGYLHYFLHSLVHQRARENDFKPDEKLNNRQRSEQQLRFVLIFAKALLRRNVNPREDLLWFQ